MAKVREGKKVDPTKCHMQIAVCEQCGGDAYFSKWPAGWMQSGASKHGKEYQPDGIAWLCPLCRPKAVPPDEPPHWLRAVAALREITQAEYTEDVPDYSTITAIIGRVPLTWLPGLLAAIAAESTRRGVFAEGGAVMIVERAVARERNRGD